MPVFFENVGTGEDRHSAHDQSRKRDFILFPREGFRSFWKASIQFCARVNALLLI